MTEKSTVTQSEFNLISTAIQALLIKTAHTKKLEASCIHFASFGAAIMKHQLNISCRTVAGAWFLHHPDGQRVLGFGKKEGDNIRTKKTGFHMWVQTKTHIIDFMSPLYPEIFSEAHSAAPIQRRMLQIPLEDDAQNKEDFNQGDPLMALPDARLTRVLGEGLAKDIGSEDLIKALLRWWPNLQKQPYSSLVLATNRGERLEILPTGHQANGIWKGPSVITQVI